MYNIVMRVVQHLHWQALLFCAEFDLTAAAAAAVAAAATTTTTTAATGRGTLISLQGP